MLGKFKHAEIECGKTYMAQTEQFHDVLVPLHHLIQGQMKLTQSLGVRSFHEGVYAQKRRGMKNFFRIIKSEQNLPAVTHELMTAQIIMPRMIAHIHRSDEQFRQSLLTLVPQNVHEPAGAEEHERRSGHMASGRNGQLEKAKAHVHVSSGRRSVMRCHGSIEKCPHGQQCQGIDGGGSDVMLEPRGRVDEKFHSLDFPAESGKAKAAKKFVRILGKPGKQRSGSRNGANGM